MSFIEMKNICKKYAGAEKNSVTDFNLSIEEGEFIAFVGPSGCGKSTTLRMIAGFEEITSGDFYIDGKRMNTVLPRDRGISMVFQNYALYPHMTVEYFLWLEKYESSSRRNQEKSGLGNRDSGTFGISLPEAKESFRRTAAESRTGACNCQKSETVSDG